MPGRCIYVHNIYIYIYIYIPESSGFASSGRVVSYAPAGGEAGGEEAEEGGNGYILLDTPPPLLGGFGRKILLRTPLFSVFVFVHRL